MEGSSIAVKGGTIWLKNDYFIFTETSSITPSVAPPRIWTDPTTSMSSPIDVSYELSQLPALEPPVGVVPNFTDPYTRGPMLLALSAIAIGIMYLFVTARIYCKVYVQHKCTWDDGE